MTYPFNLFHPTSPSTLSLPYISTQAFVNGFYRHGPGNLPPRTAPYGNLGKCGRPAYPRSRPVTSGPNLPNLPNPKRVFFRDARVYALVGHIQTTDVVDELCQLVVVDGDVAAEGEIITSRVQTVPHQVSALVDMQLHPGHYALSCRYRSKQYADAGSGGGTSVGRNNGIGDSHDDTSLWIHYPPSHSTMVSSQPTVTAASKAGHDALLDALALRERTRILNLYYSPYGANPTDADLEEALHQL